MTLILKALVISIPFTFIWSIFILELNLVIISFYSIFNIIKEKKLIFFNNFLFKLILTFSFYLIITRVYFHEIDLGLNYSIFYIRYIIYIICLSYVIDKIKFKKKFLFIFLIVSLFLAIDAYIQFFTGYNLFGAKLKYIKNFVFLTTN